MRGQRGAALVVVLILLAATGLAATLALHDLRLQQRLVSAGSDRQQARDAADAVLESAAGELAARVASGACEQPRCGLTDRAGLDLFAGHDWRAGDRPWWRSNALATERGRYLLIAGGVQRDPDDGEPEARFFHAVARGRGRRDGTVAIHAATWRVEAGSSTPRPLSRRLLR